MTSDKRSQEAEDVARDQTCPHVSGPYWCPVCLARLVREGQIRCLEEVAKTLCDWPDDEAHQDGALCDAKPIWTRIAALKQEG